MSSKFALKLTDLDDFITPSQECIKPIPRNRKPRPNAGTAAVTITMDDTPLPAPPAQKVEITLNDCLACSGCITSAETVLLTQQSKLEFLKSIEKTDASRDRLVVISVSPQSRASIAAHFDLPFQQTFQKLVSFFKLLGADYVFDTSFGQDISTLESMAEFVARYKDSSMGPVPLLCSSCPGWICYAEKLHGDYVLPFVSTVKSPQQIMGTLVKYYLGERLLKRRPDTIYHVAIMPCYDRKLEASRDDFYNELFSTRDVDCVLTSGEILDIITEKSIDFVGLPDAPIDPLFANLVEGDGGSLILAGPAGGSGGYLENIFRYAAKELFGKDIPPNIPLEYKIKSKRNTDFKTVALEVDGREVLSFAAAYGVRNIPNFTLPIKEGLKRTSGSSPPKFHFVEVMACPSGCLNGGGQIRATRPGEDNKAMLRRVEEKFSQQHFRPPQENVYVRKLYAEWFGEGIGPGSPAARKYFHTQYHSRKDALPSERASALLAGTKW